MPMALTSCSAVTIATGSAQAGLARISTHMDDVARTLGTLSTTTKDRALHAAAEHVLLHVHEILAANAADLEIAGQ